MKISNFRNYTPQTIESEHRAFATVDVTTGILFWRRTVAREIFKPPYSQFWRWLDGGDYAPNVLDTLETAHQARMGKP